MAFLTDDSGVLFDASNIEYLNVEHYNTSSGVYLKANGVSHRMAIFTSKKLSDKYPSLEGRNGADLPDPKSLKKARKKAEAYKARLVAALDIQIVEV